MAVDSQKQSKLMKEAQIFHFPVDQFVQEEVLIYDVEFAFKYYIYKHVFSVQCIKRVG